MKSIGQTRGNHDLKERRRRCGRTTMGGEVKTKLAVIQFWGHMWWAGTFALVLYLSGSAHAFSSRSMSFECNPLAMQARTRRRTVREMASSGQHEAEGESSSSRETNAKVRAAVYQPPIARDEALSSSTSAETNPLKVLTEVAAVLQLAAQCGIDVVQFPELFLPGGGEFIFQTANSPLAPLDRTAYALNIVGNLCGELNVACVMGYAEAKHESETENENHPTTPHRECYSSLALFHADGSRAGNYRCLHPNVQEANSVVLAHGHALVEAIPIGLTLPARHDDTDAARRQRQLQVGPLCGGDLWMPEHAKHLARSGAQLLVVSGSLRTNPCDEKVAQHVLIARSMENHLPVLFSNYVQDKDDGSEDAPPPPPPPHKRANMAGVGMSAILSSDGTELVRAPASLDGDMPSDEGYFLPCEETGGALYAADLTIPRNPKLSTSLEDASMDDQWEITPRIDQLGDSNQGEGETATNENDSEPRVRKGFGRQVVEVLEQSKKTKKKQRLRLKN